MNYAWFLLLFSSYSFGEVVFFGQIGDPFDNDGLMMHAYIDGSAPTLTRKKDGAQVFKVHKPAISGVDAKRALSIESVRFPGYFLYASDDNKLFLKVPKSAKEKLGATFREHFKVQTKFYIYSREGKMYDFICNEQGAPYPMRIKTDDNSRFFADRCSYGFLKLTEDQADRKMKEETGFGMDQQPAGGYCKPMSIDYPT